MPVAGEIIQIVFAVVLEDTHRAAIGMVLVTLGRVLIHMRPVTFLPLHFGHVAVRVLR